MESVLLLAFCFMAAGIALVPVAARLGLGSVLGFLIAGVALSPLLTALGVDIVSIQHFAEFGVVMMLFLVGLELEPRLLWQMRTRLFGLGGLQVALTTAVIAAAALALGQPVSIALAVGLVLALSSTAIVLQSLGERGAMKSDGGQASFSVLLFQDIAVIPMLALIPLLAMPDLVASLATQATHATDPHAAEAAHGPALSLVDGLSGWARAAVTIAAIGTVILGGSLLTRPIFRFVALARLRELFTAAALMIVIGIALLMMLVGLSPALGTFLAGVVLANSEYRHELESDIAPFKGLLLGLFFITVGAAIDFSLLAASFGSVLGLTLGLMAVKGGVLLVLGYIFHVRGADRWLMAMGMAQAGEFSFVLLSFTVANQVLPQALADQLLLVVALSMLLTPLAFILFDRLVAPRFTAPEPRAADTIHDDGAVIIAGHGRFGGIVNRMLLQAGFKTVVLDHSSATLDMLRTFGIKVFFGDATRPDLLHAAGIEHARVLVVAIDDRHQATELVRHVTQSYPHVHVIARARNRDHVYELWGAGCRDIIRETFDSAVRTGRSTFEALGIHPFEAHRRAREFEKGDRRALRLLDDVYDPDIPTPENAAYVARAREVMQQQEAEMRGGPQGFASRIERGWAPPRPQDVTAHQSATRPARKSTGKPGGEPATSDPQP